MDNIGDIFCSCSGEGTPLGSSSFVCIKCGKRKKNNQIEWWKKLWKDGHKNNIKNT